MKPNTTDSTGGSEDEIQTIQDLKILYPSPVAQIADIGFKVVLLERLNQKWKQKHI